MVQAHFSRFSRWRASKSREIALLQNCTPPSNWIYEYFEIKCVQPEWPWGTLQSSSGKFFDSPYRFCPLYGEFSKPDQNLWNLAKSKKIFFWGDVYPLRGGLGPSPQITCCFIDSSYNRPIDRKNRASIVAARGRQSRHKCNFLRPLAALYVIKFIIWLNLSIP